MMELPKNPRVLMVFVRRMLRERKYLAISIASWLVMGLLGIFFLFPQVQQAFEGYGSLDKDRKTLADLRQKLDFIQTFQTQTFVQQKDRINAILPSNKPLLPLLNALNALSQEQQVFLTGLALDPGTLATAAAEQQKTESGLVIIPVELKVTGQLEQVNTYLNRLGEIAPLLDVADISLAPTRARGATGSATQYEGTLKVSSYYAPLSIKSTLAQKLPAMRPEDEELLNTLTSFTIFEIPVSGPTAVQGKVDLFAY